MTEEIEIIEACWLRLSKLDEHARARALLWLVRKHQNVGVEIDLRALEAQAVQPADRAVVEEIAAVVNDENTRPVELEAAPARQKTALEESVDGVRREVSRHLAEAIKELTQHKLSYEDGDEVTLKLTLSNDRGRIWNKETKEYDDREAIVLYASLTTRRAL